MRAIAVSATSVAICPSRAIQCLLLISAMRGVWVVESNKSRALFVQFDLPANFSCLKFAYNKANGNKSESEIAGSYVHSQLHVEKSARAVAHFAHGVGQFVGDKAVG
eukprot:5753074-Pleurochrysis_carterae.AAC.1